MFTDPETDGVQGTDDASLKANSTADHVLQFN